MAVKGKPWRAIEANFMSAFFIDESGIISIDFSYSFCYNGAKKFVKGF